MSVSAFAERLRNAMNSRELKQVDLVHAAERRGVKMGKATSANMLRARPCRERMCCCFWLTNLMSMRTGFVADPRKQN